MIIKQCLKLLNTLGFSLKNKVVFLIREGYQISRSVVILDSIQVVNEPTFRQAFVIRFFPNHNMFLNMTPFSSAWMFWHIYTYITPVTFCTTTFPKGRVFSSIFGKFLSYIWAFPALYRSTSPTSNCIVATWLATVNAGMFMLLLPSLRVCFPLHTFIIACYQLGVKRV